MSLFSSIIIAIILSYGIIRIETISDIYSQVSKTEGLAELQWVIGLSVAEKIKSIYKKKKDQYTSREYHLCFQE